MVDLKRYNAINRLLASGSSWNVVQKTIKCSRSPIIGEDDCDRIEYTRRRAGN
ncbi:MAG: hypothetical protein PHG00_08395 [Methylococcales bacterium]|nr:hypothetical protein [Methylococcales bacterium]